MLHGALAFTGGWTLAENQLLDVADGTGALFTTSNGYLGVRGARREPVGDGGMVLIAGLHETRPYAHPERSFGVPEHYQTILAVTDPTGVGLRVDGVAVTPGSGTWLDHGRTLDLRTGVVSTAGTWRSPRGGALVVRTSRFASLEEPGLLWTTLDVEPVDQRVRLEVELRAVANTSERTFPNEPEALGRAWGRVLRPAGTLRVGSVGGLVHRTTHSQLAVACAVDVDAAAEPVSLAVSADRIVRRYEVTVAAGERFAVVQRAAFADGGADDADDVLQAAASILERTATVDPADAVDRQRTELDRFWAAATVDLEGAPDVEAAVRYCTFQVRQAVARNPGRGSPAKGLTGQGYEGHHLWDQEVYVGHALTLVDPPAARSLLAFRCGTLAQARARADQLSHRGAQFPWRTIDGTEASAFFPAGAAQFHVDADIAWAIDHHASCTGDHSLLDDGGTAVLVETARFWLSLGRVTGDGFVVEGVTGPDEYTALVDNNVYTNLMAARNLERAATRLDELERRDPARFGSLADTLGLRPEERSEWRRAAGAVFVPYDEALGLHPQDDAFLQRPRWDLASTPPGELPLQDHHHLLTLYRHQVCKQADLVAALYLVAERFPPVQRRRDFDYYEALTTHDSSLSAPIHAIVAAGVDRPELAWRHLRDAATTDLDDRYGTLGDGLHLAASAGAWLAVACGFGGFSPRGAGPSFRPTLPPGVDRLCFRLRYRGTLVEVDADAVETTYRVLDGPALTVHHDDEPIVVGPDAPARRPTWARRPPHVAVVGLMGSGKSPVAARLADVLGRPCADGDAVLEARTGRTAATIAESAGAAALHEQEAAVLREVLAADTPSVVAPAASVVDDDACIALLRERALVVWLRADVEHLVPRAVDEPNRPLDDDVAAELAEQARRRHHRFRSAADCVVDTDVLDVDAAVDQVLRALGIPG